MPYITQHFIYGGCPKSGTTTMTRYLAGWNGIGQGNKHDVMPNKASKIYITTIREPLSWLESFWKMFFRERRFFAELRRSSPWTPEFNSIRCYSFEEFVDWCIFHKGVIGRAFSPYIGQAKYLIRTSCMLEDLTSVFEKEGLPIGDKISIKNKTARSRMWRYPTICPTKKKRQLEAGEVLLMELLDDFSIQNPFYVPPK